MTYNVYQTSGINTITLDDYLNTTNANMSTSINATSTSATYPMSPFISVGSSSFNWSDVQVNDKLSGSELSVKGNANFEGDVKIKGKSIADSLERIEERLAILRPNEELEEKWDNLRALRNAYMELEAEIKEKEEVWKILKK